jgi:hypothetical protein
MLVVVVKRWPLLIFEEKEVVVVKEGGEEVL